MHRFSPALASSHGLLALVLLGAVAGCTSLTEPPPVEKYQRVGEPVPPVTSAAPKPSAAPTPAPAADAAPEAAKEPLQSKDITVGKGNPVKAGDQVSVLYKGTLLDGTEFDSSAKHAAPGQKPDPFTVVVGAGRVIKGWDEGLIGMKVGGKRELVIPAHLAYGARSPTALIPPNSTLKFEIELLEVKPGPAKAP